MSKIQLKTSRKSRAIEALAYAFRQPGSERYAQALASCHDENIHRAHDCIVQYLQRPETFRHELLDNDNLLLTFALTHGYGTAVYDVLTQALTCEVRKTKRPSLKPSSLADEIFNKQTRMTLPGIDYFTGYYPRKPNKTCNSYTRVDETGGGISLTVRKARLWRSRMMGGMLMPKCPHCYYERVIRFCKQIEYEVSVSLRKGRRGLFVSLMPASQFKSFTQWTYSQKRNHNQQWRYIALPQHSGLTAVIHDANDKWHGERIGTDIAELFNLMENLADTPTKQRVSSVENWGGSWAKVKGDTRPKQKENEQPSDGAEVEIFPQQPTEQQPGAQKVSLLVKDRGKLVTAIHAAYGITIKQRDFMAIDMRQFIELLDAAGLEYAVIAGQQQVDLWDKGQVLKTPNTTLKTTCPLSHKERQKEPDRQLQPVLLGGLTL